MNFKKNVEKKIYKKFFKTYVLKTNILYKKFVIENLISTKECHKVACLKDCMIYDYIDEFLKRYYKKNESKSHIPKFVNYYKNYLNFFCKPTFSSITFNNIIQNNGEKKAEIYYNNNYGNKNKNKKEENKKYKNIFSESIKESINDISLFNENDNNKTINLNNSNFSRYLKKNNNQILDESESNSIYNLLMNLNNKKNIKTERLSLNKRFLNNFNNNNNIIAIDKIPDEINTHSSRKNTFYNSNSKISNVSNSHTNNNNNNHIHIIAENKKNKSRNVNNNILFKMNTNNIEINKNPLFISQPHLIYTITQNNNLFSANLNKNKIKIKAQNKKINSISPPKIINENINSHRRSNSNLIKLKETKLNKENNKKINNFNNVNNIITSFNNFEMQQKILNNGKKIIKNNINFTKTFSPNKFSSNSSINANTMSNFNSNRKKNFKLTQNKIHLKLSSNNKLTKVIKLNYK